MIDKTKDLFYVPPKSESFPTSKQVFLYSLLDTCKKKKTLRVPIFNSSNIDSPNNQNDVVNKNCPLNSRMYICYSLNILVKFNLWSYWYRRGDPAWGVTLRCSVYGSWLSGERAEDLALRYSLEATNQMVRVRERVWGRGPSKYRHAPRGHSLGQRIQNAFTTAAITINQTFPRPQSLQSDVKWQEIDFSRDFLRVIAGHKHSSAPAAVTSDTTRVAAQGPRPTLEDLSLPSSALHNGAEALPSHRCNKTTKWPFLRRLCGNKSQ